MNKEDRIISNELGDMRIEGIAVSIKPNTYKVSKQFKNAIKEIELQFKHSAISQEEYYGKMESLRDTYLEKGTKEWWQYTNKIISYEKKLVETASKEIEKLYSDIAKTVCKSQEEIIKAQTDFAEKLKETAPASYSKKQIFVGFGERGGDLVVDKMVLTDLDKKKEELNNYFNLLSAVKERGESFFGKEGFYDFFSMLRDLSVEEGSGLSKLLLEKNDAGFYDFVGDFNEIQKMSDEYSKYLFKDDTEKLANDTISYMKASLSEYGLQIPEDFFKSGILSAEKFGQGFSSKIQEVMAEISAGFEALMPDMNFFVGKETGGAQNSSVFAPVYNIYGSGETTAEKLQSAKAQATVDKMRGGY